MYIYVYLSKDIYPNKSKNKNKPVAKDDKNRYS